MTINWYRNFIQKYTIKPLPRHVLVPRPNEEKILIPYKYFIETNKTDFVQQMVNSANEWYGIPDQYLQVLKEISEMLFAAGVLIDDIEDGSVLRRGQPTAYVKFGIPATINAANYIYFLAQEKITKELPPEMVEDALKILIEGMLNLHIGQGMEIYWRDRMICPTEEEYRTMATQKAGAAILACFKVGALFNPVHQEKCRQHFVRAIELASVYAQIRDDYANLVSKAHAESIVFAEDITEGKFSFPAIHCIRSNPDDTRLLDILKMRTADPDLKRQAVQIMQEAGSLEYALQTCLKLEEQIEDQCEVIRQVLGIPESKEQLKKRFGSVIHHYQRYSPKYINTELEPSVKEVHLYG